MASFTCVRRWLLTAIALGALACSAPYSDTESSIRFDKSTWDLPDDDLWGFVEIPEGSFRMGRSDSEPDAEDDESPAHDTRVPAFFIAKYETTIGQYYACIQDGVCLETADYAFDGGRDSPIRYVSWIHAAVYCDWLEKKLLSAPHAPSQLLQALSQRRDGRVWHVTLPSEAEWERVARGTSGRRYPWGESAGGKEANIAEVGRHRPVAVGSFPADRTPEGIYDLAGNVMEWTRTGYRDYPYRPDDGREIPYVQDRYVVRGGAFLSPPRHIRASDRNGHGAGDRSSSVGFRVVISRDVERPTPPVL